MMPDFANMTEEEQIAFAMQMSMADARKFFFTLFFSVNRPNVFDDKGNRHIIFHTPYNNSMKMKKFVINAVSEDN